MKNKKKASKGKRRYSFTAPKYKAPLKGPDPAGKPGKSSHVAETGEAGRKKMSKGLSDLIALGKEKGHLTFEEVNNLLPIDIVSSEEIDEILGILGDENIKLIDSEKAPSKESLSDD